MSRKKEHRGHCESKGAVFFYFGSKEAVLLELLKRVRAIVVDEGQEGKVK
jgi:hypothetical protein